MHQYLINEYSSQICMQGHPVASKKSVPNIHILTVAFSLSQPHVGAPLAQMALSKSWSYVLCDSDK